MSTKAAKGAIWQAQERSKNKWSPMDQVIERVQETFSDRNKWGSSEYVARQGAGVFLGGNSRYDLDQKTLYKKNKK
jgi:hypothetical protein